MIKLILIAGVWININYITALKRSCDEIAKEIQK